MVQWLWKVFNELSKKELYQILSLRQQIFIVEQNCVYQDIDNLDETAWHLIGFDIDDRGARNISAYLRVLGPDVKYPEISIGRVLVSMQARDTGLGRALMAKAISILNDKFHDQPIRISAQYHLKGFYSAHGFEQVSETYNEDGIPHIEMFKA
jgi:ElaA protein